MRRSLPVSMSTESHIVLIDMDSTLFDFEAPINRALANCGIALADPTSHFYIAERYQDQAVIELIHSTQNDQGFFLDLSPIPGAIKSWNELRELGYHPRICSKPLRANPYCVEEKLAAIDYYFGPEAADTAYIGRDKESEKGIALIDDRPGLTDGTYWKRIIYTQPWNQHENGLRINS